MRLIHVFCLCFVLAGFFSGCSCVPSPVDPKGLPCLCTYECVSEKHVCIVGTCKLKSSLKPEAYQCDTGYHSNSGARCIMYYQPGHGLYKDKSRCKKYRQGGTETETVISDGEVSLPDEPVVDEPVRDLQDAGEASREFTEPVDSPDRVQDVPPQDSSCACGKPGVSRACGSDKGECNLGQEVCQADCTWSACLGGRPPSKELCNGRDDDCDGKTDEEVKPKPCYNGPPGTEGKGICRSGLLLCASGQWQPCNGATTPANETCNGKDDDCDGNIDEDCPCKPGQTRSCGVNRGICKAGTQSCENGQWAKQCVGEVSGQSETCNGKDDDCNGQVDDTYPEKGKNCQGPKPGQCIFGTQMCVSGALKCIGPSPKPEVCNGKDDDCDSNIDEDFPEKGVPCTISGKKGECSKGKKVCIRGIIICEGPSAQSEVCNGKDDNCDGAVDEVYPEQGLTCSVTGKKGPCANGTKTCVSGKVSCVSSVKPLVETCNGKDDDCDGSVDETFPELDASCTDPTQTGDCKNGLKKCTAGRIVCKSMSPLNEKCDGKDNDCDGQVDELLTRTCTSGCGIQVCKNGSYTSCTSIDTDNDTHPDHCKDFCPSFKDQTNSATRCRSTAVKGFYFAALGSSGWCAYRSDTGSISWIILRNGMAEVTGVHCLAGKKCVIICGVSSLSGLKSSYNFGAQLPGTLKIVAEQLPVSSILTTPSRPALAPIYATSTGWVTVKFRTSTDVYVTKIDTSGTHLYRFTLQR